MSKKEKKTSIYNFSPTFILFGFLLLAVIGGLFFSFNEEKEMAIDESGLILSQDSFLVPLSNPENPPPKVVSKFKTVITAYSSTPEQTNEDPFTTASNKRVADGFIANNYFPFGTKIRIPELYGDKIFVVEDRMNRRKSDFQFDIWFDNCDDAINFGVARTYVEVLER